MRPLAMTRRERERFLAEARVAVVAHTRSGLGAPAASPVWYLYRWGGDLEFVTAASSEKARRLAVAPAVTVLVQDERHPQRYVAVGGDARVATGAAPELRRAIASRYLDAADVDVFLESTVEAPMVTVSVTPRSWRSIDFAKIASEAPLEAELRAADAAGRPGGAP